MDFMIVVKRNQLGKKQALNTRDDIVWRGQLSERWLSAGSTQSGSFGDVDLTFELVEY